MTTTPTNDIGFTPTETAGTKVGQFLQAHNEIEFVLPALVGMTITNRLRLRGATALLVNLTVAGLVREAIEVLKQQGNAVPVAGAETTSETESIYTLVHSVPGRIRLRMPRLGSDRDYARRLEGLLNADEYVLGVRVNRTAASMVIRYQVGVLSDWELGMRLTNIVNQAESGEQQSQEVETTDTESSEEES